MTIAMKGKHSMLIGLIVAVLLLSYLVYALVYPEMF